MVSVDDQVEYIINDIPKIVTPEYTLRAIKKYQQKNKEKINEKNRTRNIERYHNDPEYREKEKQKALERYYKRKTTNNERK